MPEPPPGYRILARLATGGMAELYLGQRLGAGGITKAVALKRIRADLVGEPALAQMFLSEARIAVELSHGNVTSVFDVAEVGGTHWLVMEYVRGWDLGRVLGACVARGTPMPVPLALFVALELTKALEHAHERTDRDGRPLGLVHRDVSPQNVLLSRDGGVMLTDFGIARVAAAASGTGRAFLKGKLGYMSPEQSRAEPLDGRADLFSLGIVLWEMLTARRCFSAVEERVVLELVQAARVPAPSELRAEVPAEVDALVLQALAREPGQRFANARQMQIALSLALGRIDAASGADDLARFLRTLELPEPLDPHELAGGDLAPGAAAVEPADAATVVRPLEPASSGLAAPRRAVPSPSRGQRVAAAVAAFALTVGLGAGIRRLGSAPPEPAPTRLEIRSPIAGAALRIDGAPARPLPVVIEGLPRKVVEVRVERDGFAPWTRSLDLAATPDLVLDVALDAEPRARP